MLVRFQTGARISVELGLDERRFREPEAAGAVPATLTTGLRPRSVFSFSSVPDRLRTVTQLLIGGGDWVAIWDQSGLQNRTARFNPSATRKVDSGAVLLGPLGPMQLFALAPRKRGEGGERGPQRRENRAGRAGPDQAS